VLKFIGKVSEVATLGFAGLKVLINEYPKESTVCTLMNSMNIYICISCILTDMKINETQGT
jgi:hypothetical protein